MLEVDTCENLAELAGLTARGRDASATAAVRARENWMRLAFGTHYAPHTDFFGRLDARNANAFRVKPPTPIIKSSR